MTARSPGAFMLSATFHALIIGIIVLFAFVSDQNEKVAPRVLELVAGEGDNFGATEAPALGAPGGVKLDLPAMPEPKPAPPQPAPAQVQPEPQPAPIQPPEPVKAAPTPQPKAVVKESAPVKKAPTFKQIIQRKVWAADARAKKEAAKERAEEAKRLKKEEFDRQRAKAAAVASARSSSTRVSHIDAEGIAKGVVGGSTANKIGGAGGKALVASEGALTDRYFAMLKQRVLNALDKPAGVSDDLEVTVIVHISASGRLSNARVEKSSGSDDFDRAVIEAFNRVEMPEHPEHKSEDLELTFRTKDKD